MSSARKRRPHRDKFKKCSNLRELNETLGLLGSEIENIRVETDNVTVERRRIRVYVAIKATHAVGGGVIIIAIVLALLKVATT